MASQYHPSTNVIHAHPCKFCGKLTRDTGTGCCRKCLFGCYVEDIYQKYGADSREYRDAKAVYEDHK